MIRCKFRMTEQKNTIGYWDGAEAIMATVKMIAVHSEDPDDPNKAFWDATPHGEFLMGTVNPAAIRELVVGKEYYIDLTPVDPPLEATQG